MPGEEEEGREERWVGGKKPNPRMIIFKAHQHASQRRGVKGGGQGNERREMKKKKK